MVRPVFMPVEQRAPRLRVTDRTGSGLNQRGRPLDVPAEEAKDAPS
jgi:hypothetical protein